MYSRLQPGLIIDAQKIMGNSMHTKATVKVLLVAMADSIHVARWLELLVGSNLEITLISSSPHRRIHPRIQNLTRRNAGQKPLVTIPFYSRHFSLPLWFADRVLDNRVRGHLLKRFIRRHKPDIVHAMELQNAGYAVLAAYESLTADSRPPLMVTNYGSDIFWFQRFPKHKNKLERLLKLTDAYSAECQRDLALARTLGLVTELTCVFPNTGGVPSAQILLGNSLTQTRSIIAIKGYEGVFGRAFLALEVVESLAEQLREFEIVLFSCNRKTAVQARRIANRTNLHITCHGKNRLSHHQMLALFRKSIAYIGISKSDGISTSMLEAMSQGAVPLQSGTACANEWIENGKSGFILDLDNLERAKVALLRTISDSHFREIAQELNAITIAQKYTTDIVEAQCRAFYRSALKASGIVASF